MAVAWEEEQVQQVAAVLAKHPPRSNECDLAARAILPLARLVDDSARAVKIKPAGRARFLMPNVSLGGEWWYHHVTTEVTAHYVDCLTGPPGTAVTGYFAEHYQHEDPDAYVVRAIELEKAA